MENEFFYYDGKSLYSKVTGKKVATAKLNYYNGLGMEENINFCSKGALIKKKIGLLIWLKFINNDGTTLFSVYSKNKHKFYVYDINAYTLKSGILLSYTLEKDKLYEYRTFDGKKFATKTMADLIDYINKIDGVSLKNDKPKHKKSERVYTKFLFSCLGQDLEDSEEENEKK